MLKYTRILKINQASLDSEFGHYACILIDVDLSKHLRPSNLLIERNKHSLFVEIDIESLPKFWPHCLSVVNCRKDKISELWSC